MANDKLYKLAAAYEKLSLFRALKEYQIFGVRLPSGEIAYCSVLGHSGISFGLNVYVGAENFDTYRHLFFSKENTSENEGFFRFINQKYLQCLLTTKDELSDEELKAEKSFSKRNKIYFRARHSHPRFLKSLPMMDQIFIEDAADEEILELALIAAIEVGEKYLSDNLPRKIEFADAPPIRRKFPLLTPEGENFIWTMEDFLPLRHIQYPVPKFNAAVLKKFKRKKKISDYSCELFVIQYSLPDVSGEYLKFPTIMMLMNNEDRKIDAASLPELNYLNRPEDLLNPLIKLCTKKGVPEKIFVRENRTYEFLEDFCEQAEIELVEVEDIEDMDEAEDEVVALFDEDMEENTTAEDYIEKIIELIDAVPTSVLREIITEDVKKILQNMIDDGVFDARISKKVLEILK